MELGYLIIGIAIVIFIVLSLFEKPKSKQKTKAEFYTEQQEKVAEGGYRAQCLLNQTEKAAFRAILASKGQRRIFAYPQVSLGEVLSHPIRKQYYAINSKRVDFLITDSDMMPKLAIEIHGTGHSGRGAYNAQTTELRDSIKKSALESAGIEYLSITTNAANAYTAVLQAVNNWRADYDAVTTTERSL